ncbi:MAG TPA: uL15m family ribosomal protein, partial [Verrucomicrobiae bacterium]|nr:uL15m family ribosomal protein [Verrucomicrobiae bacterium]
AFTTRYLPVNLESLNQFDNGATVDETAFRNAGLANGKSDGVKILGDGDLKKKLTVRAHAFSKSAKEKIEGQGGTCEVIDGAATQASGRPATPSSRRAGTQASGERTSSRAEVPAAPAAGSETPAPAKQPKAKKAPKAPEDKKP